MTKHVYVLSDNEKHTIDLSRRLQHAQQEILEKRKNCQHNWRYDGHSHNDDCYICTLCGETDWR